MEAEIRIATTEEVSAWAAEMGLTMPEVHAQDLKWVWYETPEWVAARMYKGWVPADFTQRPFDDDPGLEADEIRNEEWERRFFFVYDIGLCFVVCEGHFDFDCSIYFVQRVEDSDQEGTKLLMKPWNETCDEISGLVAEYGESEM
jgi:hypothetical protein